MKIAVCSDVHNEFGILEMPQEEADVLVLSGDIVIAALLELALKVPKPEEPPVDEFLIEKSIEMSDFLRDCTDKYPLVILVAGNHEHYNGDYTRTVRILREHCNWINTNHSTWIQNSTRLEKRMANIVFMENNTLVHDGVTFIGCTLWTDMNKRDPVSIAKIGRSMNDYYSISNGNSRLHPEDTIDAHEASLAYIKAQVASAETDKVVVCTHHAPTKLSGHPRYNDVHINSAYSSDLSEFILDSPKIKLWTHGHTHNPLDYTVGETRIVCNPRGYINHEHIADDFKLKVVSI